MLVFISTNLFSQKNKDFYLYKIKGTGLISIPKSLEKQDGEYKKLSEKAQKDIREEVTEDRVIFQKKGRNKAYKDKSPSYEKITFETHLGLKCIVGVVIYNF